MPSERVQRKIDSLLDEAEAAITRKEWKVVRDRAEAALALDRENADATHYLEAAQFGLKSAVPSDALPMTVAIGCVSGSAPSVSVLPTSFASGRYAVKKFLGEGGKKKVYLAHDTVLDRDVAFALIKTEGLDAASRTRITREAQAMGRLGDHPNIMPIFDLGQETDPASGIQQPFMVIPYMTGGDVEALIEKGRRRSSPSQGEDSGGGQAPGLPLERALQIANDTCEGLVFAHSKGIVHRDLKPGNVWLTERGIARIGDFGLAVATDRSRLTREGMMVGTVAYMPPEQAMGGEITPRADLYSLGAMLYEMVTGRPPFLGDDDIAIIGQHINTPPVAPTWHRPDCPKPLDALIMRLLAKDPKQRPESAKDVLAALEAVDVKAVPSPLAGEGKGEGSQQGRSLDSMSSGVFVGRQKEIGELRAALEEALSGRGRLVMLVGEPGIGKTRTSTELATYAGLRRAQVLWGRCYESQGAPPYWPWVQAIRSYVREKDPSQVRTEMGSGAADIAEIVSDVRERLPGLQPSPQLDSPEASRFRLFDSITAFLKGASRTQPIVLVLDDLHWADKPSLLLLEFLAKELQSTRLLVVGTFRDVELNRRHALTQTLGELGRERLFSRIQLKGLSQDDVGKFIELTSGRKPPGELISAVYSQTEGNPLFVTEVVRLLVQEGALDRAASGDKRSLSIDIPAGVREVISRRLQRLSERCNDVLTTASVIGREFTLQQLAAVGADPSVTVEERLTEDRLLEVVEEALGGRVIEELSSEAGRYQFTHALIQDTLANELSATRRVRLHARIALALERMYGAEADGHASELAYHFAVAARVIGPAKAVRYSLAAGERSLADYAFEEALSHFQRALELKASSPMDAEFAAIYSGLGRAQAATLQIQDAIRNLDKAVEYYATVGDFQKAAGAASCPFPAYSGVLEGSVQLVERALALVPPDSILAGHLQARLATALYYQQADQEGARRAFGRALEIARRAGDRKLELNVLADEGFTDLYSFEFAVGLEKSVRTIDLARGTDELRALVVAHYGAVISALFTGSPEIARRYVGESIRLAERLRHNDLLSRAIWGQVLLEFAFGDIETAHASCLRGLAVAPDDARHLSTLAEIAFLRGETSLANEALNRMTRIAESGPVGQTIDNAFASWAHAHGAWVSGDKRYLSQAQNKGERALVSGRALPIVAGVAHMAMGITAAMTDDDASARNHYDELLLHRSKFLASISIDRVLAILAASQGDTDGAISHYEDAMRFLSGAGYVTDLAWAEAELAVLLSQRNGPGDRERAIALQDSSLVTAGRLGMKPLVERIIAKKKILTA